MISCHILPMTNEIPMQEVLQGFKRIEEAAALIASRNGKRVFLVTGLHYESAGRSLLENKIPFTQYLKKGVNVKEEEASLACQAFKDSGADTILAIGGGSVIDLAKTIIYQLIKKDEKKPLFIVAPTTTGSGTEATHFAVMYQEKKKLSLVHPMLLPDLVILDPELSFTQSPYQTAVSGIDVFCQAVESYWSKNANQESKEYSAAAIQLWKKYYHIAISHPDKESREGMLQASHLAGKAINITRTTGPHALSYYLTSHHSVPHGQAVAFFMPVFFLYNHLSIDLLELLGEKNPVIAVTMVREWIQTAGLATRFDELGLDKHAIIDQLLDEINQERFENNPVAFNREQLSELILILC